MKAARKFAALDSTSSEDDPIIIVEVDPSTGVTTITIPALHSQTGKPTVVKIDPNVTAAAIEAIIKGLLHG